MTTKKVTVAGVPVLVLLGEDGRPTSAGARIDRPGDLDRERIVALAAHRAFDWALAEAQQVQRKGSSADAATASAEKRAEASALHWTNEWLAKAHAEHPHYGRDRLAPAARKLALAGGIEPDIKRDEISEKRARQFLDRERNKKKSRP